MASRALVYLVVLFSFFRLVVLADRAAELYDAALFDRAISTYYDVLQDCDDDDAVRFKLAESYYQNKDYRGTIDLLEKKQKHPCDLLLLGLAYIQVESFEKAIYVLEQVDSTDARFHKGIAFFKSKRFNEAREAFDSEVELPLSQIYLSRIDIEEGDFRSASHRLELLPKDPHLDHEIAYLKGKAAFNLREFSKSAKEFEEALPKHNPDKADWYRDTIYSLGWCYLKMGDEDFRSTKEQDLYFKKAEEFFKMVPDEERFALALGQTYLTKAHRLKNETFFLEAENQLAKDELYISIEAKMQALLLRAQAASSYGERDRLYRLLTQGELHHGSFYAKGWYLRGLNDFEEGETLREQEKLEESRQAFERAVNSLEKAFQLSEKEDKTQAGAALKFQAEAYAKQKNHENLHKALEVLNKLSESSYLSVIDNPDEIFYLRGLIAAQLTNDELAFNTLKDGLKLYPEGNFADSMLLLQGTLFFQNKVFEKAEDTFLLLVEQFPNSPLAGEALFFASNCVEAREPENSEYKLIRKRVYENYPQSPYAAEAYFYMYSYRDYLQGNRMAMKHLQGFIHRFPESPFLLNVHYLIGMDYKHDRKDEEGRWIRKKNLIEAIDCFQSVESVFDDLNEKKLLSKNFQYFVTIRYRAQLERALANLSIAEESQGAKREIYLEYAQEVFKLIIQDFKTESSLAHILICNEPYPNIQEESQYGLAQSYIKDGQDDAADELFREMADRYANAKITRGYYLSRARYEQGMIAIRKNDFSLAILLLNLAEDTAKGKILTGEQKLDLWIQQSLCLRALNRLDEAILILSKAINDDAVSGLRLKAMYLRAEIYEQQGRRELARRQLESTSKKGGEWAVKAKAKLEENYSN